MAGRWRRFVHLPLASLWAVAGVAHFTHADFFAAIVPPWLPAPLPVVWLSGVVELVNAALLLHPRTRRLGGWCSVATLLAVWPANWHHALHGVAPEVVVPPVMRDATVAWLRLPLQLPLVAWAWALTRGPTQPSGSVVGTPVGSQPQPKLSMNA